MRYTNAKIQNLDPKIRELLKENIDPEKKVFTKGLFLTGNTGTGKTYALHAIRNHLKTFEHDCSHVENWVELLFELKEKMGKGFLAETLNGVTEKDIVFIDDMGAEKQTEWGQEMLYLIVNRLYEHENVLFLATNLSFQEFSEKYGDRLTSRICEMCEMKEIIGEDKRIL
jgi:DNA replication protein DnaC